MFPIVRAILFAGSFMVLSACGGGGGSNGTGSPATPSLSITSEDNQAASAAVGEAGGTVVATASNGTTYTLEVPSGALAGTETVTIVPVTAVGGLPLRGGLVAAVRFAPDGLELLTPATLTIDLPQQPAAAGLVGFGFQGSGEAFHLDLVEVQGSRLVFSVSHFSGVGTGIALTGDIQEILAQPSNNPEFRALNEIASLFAQGKTDPTLYKFKLSEWFNTATLPFSFSVDFGVKEGLEIYGHSGKNFITGADDVDERLLRRALRGYVSWLRTIGLVSKRLKPVLGPDFDIREVEFFGTLAASDASAVLLAQEDLRAAITRENARCRQEFAPGRVAALARADAAIFWQAVAQDLGLATETSDLDLASVLSGLCVKVEIADVSFPDPIPAGQTATLSFRAPVVPASFTSPVAVTIAASGAAPVPGGHTDASAFFSVPVQPIGTSGLVLDVKACLDEAAFPRLGKVCGRTLIPRGPTDTTPPTVLSTGPANGATGVLITMAPFVIFSEVMDPTTITGTTFTLSNSTSGGTVAGTVTLNASGTTATLTPSSSLAPSALYTATITIGARDLSGNRLAANFTWSFTTGTGSTPPVTGAYDGASQFFIVENGPTGGPSPDRWVLFDGQGQSGSLFRLLHEVSCTASSCTPDFSLSGGTIQATSPPVGSTLTGSVSGGQLHFVYDFPCVDNSGQAVTCRKTFDGAQATYQVTPTSLAFGTVPAGGASASQSITITNGGLAPVQVGANFSALSRFAIVGGSCFSGGPVVNGFSLGAQSACDLAVQFKPTLQGTITGTLFVSVGFAFFNGTQAGSSLTQVSLTGVGN